MYLWLWRFDKKKMIKVHLDYTYNVYSILHNEFFETWARLMCFCIINKHSQVGALTSAHPASSNDPRPKTYFKNISLTKPFHTQTNFQGPVLLLTCPNFSLYTPLVVLLLYHSKLKKKKTASATILYSYNIFGTKIDTHVPSHVILLRV